MNKIALLALATFLTVALMGCKSKQAAAPVIPDGYQGIYVVKIWEGDNSVLPKNLTGLVFKRVGQSYEIVLSNIDEKNKKAEEIEDLKYSYRNNEFHIKFGGIMKLKKVKTGLSGTLNHSGKPYKLYLKKIK